ncbi:C1 family peptidase [Mucilaginibacter sp. L3T2-6]|uniref:C1 family peptidase n=1 Tax=Mucilaginibacter sp. L3T2-6 TaxID=3062491 RepID=UPI002674F6CB|nr:C1 family peptidase [Mucilaginibacter sp. L3T2-6]MDO3641901.1 C1 family peptidase [Mucilaginibacter sp. L3T2-6]MDV6214421.1 C1 family peptidase [Mucilaginibacter sp. L3T2-6]
MNKTGRYFFTLLLLAGGSFAMAQPHSRGMDFDDNGYEQVPKKAKLTRALDVLPSKASIKQFAPYPKTQDRYGTCSAWASAYCGRTMVDAIKYNWTNRDSITQHAYSPAFLFRLLRPNDGQCTGGSSLGTAFELMKSTGSIHYTDLPALCIDAVNPSQVGIAGNSKLKDYARLFDVTSSASIKIQAVKKSISEKKPVVIGMLCPSSFDTARNCWIPKEQPGRQGGHAMCVVGYDDNQYGGAFEIQNSWGTWWGNGGYIWIRYDDFSRFVQYAYEFVDLPDTAPNVPDLSGAIKLTLSTGEPMPANLLVSTRGLKVVAAKTTPQPLTIYQTANPYTSGTNFRIYISNNQPAYVYAISSDLTNQVTKIFPYEDGISAALTYKKNDVAIPDEDHFIQFDNQPGKDFLCVLYSKNALDINDIIRQVSARTGTFNERVYSVLHDRIVDPQNIKFSNDSIAFDGTSNGKDIVAMMVELDHK